jgi:hypothetical protein
MKIGLTVVGSVLEFVGIGLVAAPELMPRLVAVKRRVGASIRRAWQWTLARLRRRRHRSLNAESGEIRITGGGASTSRGFAMVGEGAPLDRQLAFFRDYIEKADRRLDEIDQRLEGLPEEWRRDVDAAREAIDSMMEKRIEEVRDTHIRLRLVGIVLLLIGVPILATANVV